MHKSMNSSLTLSPTNAFNFQPTCFRGQELKDYLIDLSEKNKFLCSKSCLLEVTCSPLSFSPCIPQLLFLTSQTIFIYLAYRIISKVAKPPCSCSMCARRSELASMPCSCRSSCSTSKIYMAVRYDNLNIDILEKGLYCLVLHTKDT